MTSVQSKSFISSDTLMLPPQHTNRLPAVMAMWDLKDVEYERWRRGKKIVMMKVRSKRETGQRQKRAGEEKLLLCKHENSIFHSCCGKAQSKSDFFVLSQKFNTHSHPLFCPPSCRKSRITWRALAGSPIRETAATSLLQREMSSSFE